MSSDEVLLAWANVSRDDGPSDSLGIPDDQWKRIYGRKESGLSESELMDMLSAPVSDWEAIDYPKEKFTREEAWRDLSYRVAHGKQAKDVGGQTLFEHRSAESGGVGEPTLDNPGFLGYMAYVR